MSVPGKSSSPFVAVQTIQQFPIPGGPNIWRPPQLSIQLRPDDGRIFIDQNSFRMPENSFTPLMLAVEIEKPSFDFAAVDVVSDRNSLRKLLGFVSETREEPFRMDIEMVGKTLCIQLYEARLDLDWLCL